MLSVLTLCIVDVHSYTSLQQQTLPSSEIFKNLRSMSLHCPGLLVLELVVAVV